jgi:hypothetical protein
MAEIVILSKNYEAFFPSETVKSRLAFLPNAFKTKEGHLLEY